MKLNNSVTLALQAITVFLVQAKYSLSRLIEDFFPLSSFSVVLFTTGFISH